MNPSFSYYWEGAGDNGENAAMYKIQNEFGLTDVNADVLKEKGLEIPMTPTFEQWKKNKEQEKKTQEWFKNYMFAPHHPQGFEKIIYEVHMSEAEKWIQNGLDSIEK